ncbi:MAG: universal stress protein [Bacteroidetes bacterium]|nr:universal stress protein [Bacteroidota bacterium]
MKTILVPTDYSNSANNALQYAVELAQFSQATIILLHAYQIPIPTGEVPVMMIAPQELEEDNSMRIKKLEREVISRISGNIKIESVVRAGFVPDEIMDVAKEKSADLIVMGVTGSGKLGDALIGSNTISVIKHSQIPVLAIPKDTRYKKIQKIVLAYDYHHEMKENVMKKFKEFVELFKAKVLVLNVVSPTEVPAYEKAVVGVTIENSLKDTEHTVFFPSAEDISEEINEFADAHQCDLLVMVPHKHKLLERLFRKSNTKQMSFHTHIPLLTLHD